MSSTTENVSFFITFSNESCSRERYKEYVADAPSVHKNPITYFPLLTPEVFSESAFTARRVAETVRELKS